MKRLTIAVAALAAVFCAALIVLSLAGYRSLKNMRSELNTLNARVDSATRLAQQESAAAVAASKRAQQAKVQAEAAAIGRQQAEVEKQAADAGRLQAEAAKQAADAGRAQALAKAKQSAENAQQAQVLAQQAKVHAQEAQAQMLRMREERKKELDQMQQALNQVVPTRRTPNGMVIELQEATFRFAFDSAKLSETDRELLSRIAGILLVSKGYGLSIYGYTDDVGSAEYNQKLSLRRAQAVKKYLAEAGIDPSIMRAKGFGKTNPLVKGDSAAARAQNRRVEIALADSSIQYVGKAATQQ